MKYNDYTKLELIQLCKLNNIKNYSNSNKDELIKLLNKNKNKNNKKGGTNKNITKYYHEIMNKFTNISPKNKKKLRYISAIQQCIITYFSMSEYFENKENKDKDLLDYLLIYGHDDLENYFSYKLKDGRPLEHWEEIIEIIKKENNISLLKYYYLYSEPNNRYFSKYKIDYYKKLYNDMDVYIKNNNDKKFNDFMIEFREKINNKVDDVYKPFITEKLIERIQKIDINQVKDSIKNRTDFKKSQIDKLIVSIPKSINDIKILSLNKKDNLNNFAELRDGSVKLVRWEKIFDEIKKNKSLIEIITDKNYNVKFNDIEYNINNLNSIYITEKNKLIINDENEFLKDNKILSNTITEVLKLYHKPRNDDEIKLQIFSQIMYHYWHNIYIKEKQEERVKKEKENMGKENVEKENMEKENKKKENKKKEKENKKKEKENKEEENKNKKFRLDTLCIDIEVVLKKIYSQLKGLNISIEEFKDHNTLFNSMYYKSLTNINYSSNINRYMASKTHNGDTRDWKMQSDLFYYLKNNNNADFLYKMYLIYTHQLIPEIRIKYYKKIYDLMNTYKNKKNNNKSFDVFMDNYKNNIIKKKFKIEKEFELYIPEFHYCYNKNKNNNKKK